MINFILTIGEYENFCKIIKAEVFTGSDVKNEKDAEIACQKVLAREGFYIGVIVTLGDKGCIFGEKKTGKITNFPARKVNVVDTTVK